MSQKTNLRNIYISITALLIDLCPGFPYGKSERQKPRPDPVIIVSSFSLRLLLYVRLIIIASLFPEGFIWVLRQFNPSNPLHPFISQL